jgi:hypothetical protein
MGFLRRGRDQGAEGAFSEGRRDLPCDLLPVAEWAAALRSSLIEDIPEEIAVHQIGLAAEAARIAAEERRSPIAVTAIPGWRERLHLSRVPLHLAAQAAVILVALMILAGGVAAAAGVNVPALITRPFHSHTSTTVPGTAPGHEGPVGPELSPTTTSSLADVSTTVVDDDDDSTVGTAGPGGTLDDDSTVDDDEAEEPDEAEEQELDDATDSDSDSGDESDDSSGSDSSAASDSEVHDPDAVDDSLDQASDQEPSPED